MVLLARVSPEQLSSWQAMPSLIVVDPAADLPDLYLLPPVRYPDGHHYIKIGTGSIDHPLEDLNALQEWYRHGGIGDDADRLRTALVALLPELEDAAMRTDACAVTNTPSGYPIIDWVAQGRVAAACGGNGKAAKSSDELGRLAALWVSEEGSPDEFPEVLRAVG
jgi:sarcosine oxidase